VEQSADRDGASKVVVDLHCLAGFGHVDPDGPLLQVLQGGRVNPQPLLHAPGQDDGDRAAVQQLPDIDGPDARGMAHARFRPVPFAAAARVELEILPSPIPSTSIWPQETARIRGEDFP
jgi:hypothetical protein